MDIGYVIVFAIIFIIVFSLVHKKRKEKKKIQLFEEVIQKRINDLKTFQDTEPFVRFFDFMTEDIITKEKDAMLAEIPDLMIQYEKAAMNLSVIAQDNTVFMDEEQRRSFNKTFQGTKEELIERRRQDVLRSWFPIADFLDTYKLADQIYHQYLMVEVIPREGTLFLFNCVPGESLKYSEIASQKLNEGERAYLDLINTIFEKGVVRHCLRTICTQHPEYNNEADVATIARLANNYHEDWPTIFIAGMRHIIKNERGVYDEWYGKLTQYFDELLDKLGHPAWFQYGWAFSLPVGSPFPDYYPGESYNRETFVRKYEKYARGELTRDEKGLLEWYTDIE